MALIQISPLGFGGFTLRSLRFCLRSTEAEPRQDFGRGENLGCVYKAWRNEGKWLRISCEVTLTCRPQPRSLQAQHRSTTLCHSRSSPFFFQLKQFIHPQAQATVVFWMGCTTWKKKKRKKFCLFYQSRRKIKEKQRQTGENNTLTHKIQHL